MQVIQLLIRLTNLLTQLLGLLLRLVLALVKGMMGMRSTTYGSARWANFWEVWWGGAWGGKGLIVGSYRGRFLRFKAEGYALVFARTRSGKGAGIVVPALLDWPGSVICTDPKGENFEVTGRARQRFGEVHTLNVIAPEYSDAFNPLDMIRVGSFHEADDAVELARLLVKPDTEGAGHWDNRAADLLKALILYVCHKYERQPELRNLAKVCSLVGLGWDGMQKVLEEATRLGPTSLRETAGSFRSSGPTDEIKSILSNVDKATNLWSADRPAGIVSMRSTFDFREFNRRTVSAYIIVDEEKLPIYGSFLRVMMGCALIAMTRAKNEPAPATPTLLLMDEAAALGRLEPLEAGVGYLASYARMIMIWQDVDQLEKTYSKARSIMANASCKVVFGINDLSSARTLAQTIGQTTIYSNSTGSSGDRLGTGRHSHNRAEAGRQLIDESEIMRLKPHQCIVFLSDAMRRPVFARKVRYWRVWRWRGLWDRWRAKPSNLVPLPPPQTPAWTRQAA